VAVTAALVLSACGGGSGPGGSATIPPGPADGADRVTTTASPSGTPTGRAGAPLRLDPAVALPAGVRIVFDWTMPADPVQHAALTAAADFIQSIDHAVVKQNTDDPPLHAYAAVDALGYARRYVQRNIDDKLTLSGTDRYFRPVFAAGGGAKSVEIKLCDNQSKMYSKEIASGKVHVTGESDRNYVLYDIVMVRLPAAHAYWQAQGITVKEAYLPCKE
jgi:hypothetical protein